MTVASLHDLKVRQNDIIFTHKWKVGFVGGYCDIAPFNTQHPWLLTSVTPSRSLCKGGIHMWLILLTEFRFHCWWQQIHILSFFFFFSFSIFTAVAVTVDGSLLDNNEMTLLAAELSNPDYVVHRLQTFSMCQIQPQVIASIEQLATHWPPPGVLYSLWLGGLGRAGFHYILTSQWAWKLKKADKNS